MGNLIRTAPFALAFLLAWATPARSSGASPPPDPSSPSARPQVVFGTDRDYPPFEYFDNTGKPTGFNVELVRALGEELGWSVEVRMDEWPRIRRGLESERSVDFADMFRSPTRTVNLEFSEPFAVVYIEIFLRRDSPPVHSIEDLRGRTVIVQDSAIVQEHLLRLDAGARIVAAASEPEALQWLAAGKGDCAIVSQFVGRHAIRRHRLDNLVTSGVPMLPAEYCFAVAPGRTELRMQLNRGLGALRASGRYAQLHDKWFGPLLEHRLTFRGALRYAAWILGPLLLLAAAATGWSLLLRRTVTRRTAELRDELAAHALAVRQVRDSERQYADLVGSLPHGVYRMNRKGDTSTFVFLSERWAELTGLDRAAVLADSRLAFAPVHPDDLRSLREANDTVQRTLDPFHWEGRMLVRGETRWMHLDSVPSRLPDGTVQWTGMLADITAQHRTAEALRASEHKFAAAFNSSPDALLLAASATGEIVDVNEACIRITGYRREELVGNTTVVLGIWADPGSRVRYLEQLQRHRQVVEMPADLRTKSGELRHCTVSAEMIEIEGRAHTLAIVRDETERRRTEEAVRTSEERFRIVAEQTGQVIFDHDLVGGVRTWAGAAEAMVGYGIDELNRTESGWWTERVHPDDREGFAAELERLKQHGGRHQFVYRFRRRDDRWIYLTGIVSAVCDATGRPVRLLGTVADVTKLQEAAAAIRQLNAELEQRVRDRTAELAGRIAEVEQLNRELHASQDDLARAAARLQEANSNLLAANQELEAFSYSVSHDLRAPLRNIAGFIELLRKRATGTLDAEADRYFGIIGSEAVRMGALIDDLLTFSRIGRAELHFAPVQLATLVAEVQSELQSDLAGREIEWRVQPLPPVFGDRTLLRQVVANLLANAVKFTRQRRPATIEIGVQAEAPGAELATFFVRDNGAGFDPKFAAKLFGVFQRLHNARDFEGTGIGLANVKRIVNRHGGQVWADGRPEAGATFYFSLRIAATASGG